MLPSAICWFLGALLLIVGVLASLYLGWLQKQRGVTTFSLLATSDALATIAIAIAFLINAAHSQNSKSRTDMEPSRCSHGQLTMVSALFLVPFINTFISMMTHSADGLQSTQKGIEARGHDARNNPRLVSSIAAQWIVPAISTLVLLSAGIEHSRPYRADTGNTCMEGTALTPITVESMEQCMQQEDISDYITTLMNAHNVTTKHLPVNSSQTSEKEVTQVVNNIYKLLQIHRSRRSFQAESDQSEDSQQKMTTQNTESVSVTTNKHYLFEFNKLKEETSKFPNNNVQLTNILQTQSSPMPYNDRDADMSYKDTHQSTSNSGEENNQINNIIQKYQKQNIQYYSTLRNNHKFGSYFKTNELNKRKNITSKLHNRKTQTSNILMEFQNSERDQNINYKNIIFHNKKHVTLQELKRNSNNNPKMLSKIGQLMITLPDNNMEHQKLFSLQNEHKTENNRIFPELTNGETSQQLNSRAHEDETALSEFDKSLIFNTKQKFQRQPRSSPLENTPEDVDYYDTTDEYYDKAEEESNLSEHEEENDSSESHHTTEISESLLETQHPSESSLPTLEISSLPLETPVPTKEMPQSPLEPGDSVSEVSKPPTEMANTSSQTSAPQQPINIIKQESTTAEALTTGTSSTSTEPEFALVTSQIPIMTTHEVTDTSLIEIQIPDTINMCVVKCYLSENFLKKYLFVLLFLCYFIPIIASLIMYFSTPSIQSIIEVKPSTADDTCSMQPSTVPSTATVKHSILSSVLMWTPTLVETLLRAWFCVSTPQWLSTLLFVLAQAHAIIRNTINMRLMRKRACSASIQPLAESEETPTTLFTKVKAAILK